MEIPYGLNPKKKNKKNKNKNNNNSINNINNSNYVESNIINTKDSIQKIVLLIFSIMEKYGYYPKTSYFTNNHNQNDNNNKITENQDFEKHFPNFTLFFKDIDKYFSEFMEKKSNNNKNLNIELRYFILKEIYKCNSEIINFIGYFWDTLDKKVKTHTIIFLYMVNEYIKKDKINNYDKNILYWAILFHDVGKFHEMNKFFKEDFSKNKFIDKAHPYKSSIIFIQTLLNKKLIYFKDEKEKENFKNFFEKEFTDELYKSFEKEKNEKHGTIEYNICFNNFDNIENFLLMLKTHEENKWIYDIIILIIFHQSLPNNDNNFKNKRHLNKPLLDKKYIKEFFDVRLLELMRIILIYDSSSHCLFEGKWEQKIDKYFDLLIIELFS